jgi:hypothetical protein
MRISAAAGVAVLIALVLGACESFTQEPYIYRPAEFDRGRDDFRQDPKDRKSLIICYNSSDTTPEALREMAEEECGKYGKMALFDRHDYQYCPLMSPAGAVFLCQPKAAAAPAAAPAAVRPSPATPSVPGAAGVAPVPAPAFVPAPPATVPSGPLPSAGYGVAAPPVGR